MTKNNKKIQKNIYIETEDRKKIHIYIQKHDKMTIEIL